MPYKDESVKKAKHAEYSRKHYLGNYAKQREKINARRQEVRKEWNTYKASLKCLECGFAHPAALDFHHTDPSQKEYSVANLISDGRFKKAYEEVKKCIVLCANCHRVYHFMGREGSTSLGSLPE